MEKFAIIHDSAELGQILITKDFDLDENQPEIKVQFEDDGARISFNIGVKTEETAKKMFEKLRAKN
ncbi:hypothetical protein [Ornithobacterium rhinotracheale]|uniref:Uncharacterized protein n=1 Tax=Ornithobacterium rhinotracheale (strain ATCC 51463 / DSM 15997 / CCUG 23171 / CIP 104009 / LMG 9086) TaxID=867902 RepID=I4A0A7_ORNRL|nr:hypothetical protein [Ornithobacterium rhinotracheale]AFL97391.1 hypothetical protein Ornrh_1206 [Ornithobacterium rhinotracheale DSM 15997]